MIPLKRASMPRLLALITLVFIVWSLLLMRATLTPIDGQMYPTLSDDAMISMRYAQHLAQGHGLVWNIGEAPIEGFTNMLYVLIMTPAIVLFGPVWAITAIQVLGIVWVILSAFLAYRISRRAAFSPTHAAVVYGLTLTYYPFLAWSILGMETGLLAVLTLAALSLAMSPKSRFRPLLPVVVGLCFWTRPDGILIAGLIWLYALSQSHTRKQMIIEGLVIAGFVGGLSLFRVLYFGSIVPNTYTLKVDGIPLDVRLQGGISFIRPFVVSIALPLLIILVALIRRKVAFAGFCLLLVFVAMAYQVWAGGDVLPQWRMLVPVMPVLFLLMVWALSSLKWRVALPVLVVCMIVMEWEFLPSFIAPFRASDGSALVQIGRAMKAVTQDDATIAVFAAGSIPYYSERRSIDCLGKSDAYIAHLPPDLSGAVSWAGMKSVPGHNKYDLEYCIGKAQPDATERMNWGQDDLRASHPEYQRFLFEGVELWLNTRSHKVRWELVTPVE